MRFCISGNELDQTIAAMKKAVAGGTKKAVVDARNDPGGDSNACLTVLKALNMSPGEYCSVIRFLSLLPSSATIASKRQHFL